MTKQELIAKCLERYILCRDSMNDADRGVISWSDALQQMETGIKIERGEAND